MMRRKISITNQWLLKLFNPILITILYPPPLKKKKKTSAPALQVRKPRRVLADAVALVF